MAAAKIILDVDDNNVNRSILSKILRDTGYQVIEATNGQEALDILEHADPKIDLMLLDLVMPVMDGFQLLQVMNEKDMITSVPVIVLTGNEEQETEIRCLEAGASDFLKKPYNVQLVRHRIASILRLWDNAALINQLETDRLTGLYNKDCFYRKVEELLAQYPEQDYMLLYLDFDGFRMINAQYGTQAGDELLKHLGTVLKKSIGEQEICGRIGADAFSVLYKKRKIRSQEEVGQFCAENLQEVSMKGVAVKCGIYQIRDRSQSVSMMVDCAKFAERTVKHHYGAYYAVYDETMNSTVTREYQLANYMEEALQERQFVVYLQPKHNTETGALSGAEALVRWVHPELGFISPGEFIPLFERNGFIVKLDFFVWEEVCRLLHEWIAAGITPVPVSINASRADFLAADLPEKLCNLIEQYELPPELLHIEVTESAYTDNPQQIIEMTSTLRDIGFQIEMDDFGTGYSSLNMLSELPIDVLKLDMRFMKCGDNKLKGNKRNILSFVVGLSKWLQLPTVAEGVETAEEVEVLRSMGCNYIQGYYFSRPMPPDTFATYLQTHKVQTKVPEPEDAAAAPQEQKPDEQDRPLVLVVEDIASNREIVRTLLTPAYRVAEAQNGAQAYEYLQDNAQEVSCILLDLLMPVMDGFQLLGLIHQSEELSQIPVIIATESGSDGELRALNLGAHSFVAKPYNPHILTHHVGKAVEEREFLRLKKEYLLQNGKELGT